MSRDKKIKGSLVILFSSLYELFLKASIFDVCDCSTKKDCKDSPS